MLVLARFPGESIHLGREVRVLVAEIDTRREYPRVKLGITAPRELTIWRSELMPFDVLAGVERIESDRQELLRLRAALERIACYEDGKLGSHLDEPRSAAIARAALEVCR